MIDHDLPTSRPTDKPAEAPDPIAALVADLRELGEQVGSDRVAQERAWSQKTTAEGHLLEAVLDALPDAWGALLGPSGTPFVLLSAHGSHASLGHGSLEVRRVLSSDPCPSWQVCLWATTPATAVSAEWAVRTFGLGKILAALLDALDVHAGRGMVKSAEKMNRRAELVRALTVVLRNGGPA